MTPDTLVPAAALVVALLTGGLISVLSYREYRLQRALDARLKGDRDGAPPLLCFTHPQFRARVLSPGGVIPRWEKLALRVSPTRLSLHRRQPTVPERFGCAPAELRWFGRPRKYSPGANELWLHAETAAGWQIVHIRLSQTDMRALVRALKQVANPELVTAYRRRRPYIHYGPVAACPAVQDIHGAWTLDAPVRLYLMPRFLVVLDAVPPRVLPLEQVQQIGALRRLDALAADGLVRFTVGGERLAFALPGHDAFAQQLAEAARRTLEAPLERKAKSKSHDDYPPWLEDEDE